MHAQSKPRRTLPHTKPRRKPVLFSLVTLLLTMLVATTSAHAEGSKDLIKNGGYRPYIEWFSSKVYYSGQLASQTVLKRRQVIHVYAKAGETLYFGSSVDDAQVKNWFKNDPNLKTAQDIRVTTPSGGILDYNVVNDSTKPDYEGYIPNYATELKGPDHWTTGGYNALTYTVPPNGTGIYSFEFYSRGTADPKAYQIGHENMTDVTHGFLWGQNGGGIDAWDITVADVNDKPLTGRVFAPYLTVSLGSLAASRTDVLQSVVYVLTDDGYLYETDFNGINPNGFLFFGNNRGLLDLANDRSLYHSSIYTTNAMTVLQGQTGFHLPNEADTAKDKTYRIFFNEPDAELLRYLHLENPIPPAGISDFSFNGGNATRPGVGGDFHFTATRNCSYELEIQFDNNHSNTIYIADCCQAGDNVVHWDGLDYNGNIVPPGHWTAKLRTKGGEYHFPIGDAETCNRGLQIKLISTPPNPDPGFDPTLIYYDNSTKNIGGETLDFDAGRDAFVGPLTQLQGISSQKDGGNLSQALRYGTSTTGKPTIYGYGDLKLFDTWTHFTSAAYTRNLIFVVADDIPGGDTPGDGASAGDAPVPHTGDSGRPGLWILIASAAALTLLLTVPMALAKAAPASDPLEKMQKPPRKHRFRR